MESHWPTFGRQGSETRGPRGQPVHFPAFRSRPEFLMFAIERGYWPLRQPRLSTHRVRGLPCLPLLTPAPASIAVCQPKGPRPAAGTQRRLYITEAIMPFG